ncbi:putative T7SS-secreted protein [Streptomyces sp. NBC_00203]|uniref:putative T7SS-secreted protein n=1 Tax=Streptomyces sp. NBC_00203 TaxID=2975680 RepID=UPI003249A108
MSRRSSDWPPLWDDDPTPGDPDEVAALGRKLRKMAEMIDEQSKVIKALSSVEGWDSDAGRAFNEIADGAGDRLKKAFDRYDEAASALGTKVAEGESQEFAGELHRAQKKADKALADYREAKSDHDLAQREVKKFTDKYLVSQIPEADMPEYERWKKKQNEALHRIGQARKDVKGAKDIFDDAGDRAARRIRNVVHHDAVRDPGGFMNFLADWADMFSNISAILSALTVICAFIPPLQFLVPLFATLAVLTSAAALAGHAYDMSVRGGKVDWLRLGTDFLGVLPGLGAFRGFTALKGLKGLSKLRGLSVFKGGTAVEGIGQNLLNGFSVKIVNGTLAKGIKIGSKFKIPNMPKEFVPIDGKRITGVIKGTGLASALHRMFSGENGDRTGYVLPPDSPAPSPTPGLTPSPKTGDQESPATTTPSPSPGVSAAPFHAALAA